MAGVLKGLREAPTSDRSPQQASFGLCWCQDGRSQGKGSRTPTRAGLSRTGWLALKRPLPPQASCSVQWRGDGAQPPHTPCLHLHSCPSLPTQAGRAQAASPALPAQASGARIPQAIPEVPPAPPSQLASSLGCTSSSTVGGGVLAWSPPGGSPPCSLHPVALSSHALWPPPSPPARRCLALGLLTRPLLPPY